MKKIRKKEMQFIWILLFFSFFACGGELGMHIPNIPPEEDTSSPLSSDSTSSLMIAVLNVGQGDATLIITPSGKSILIDAGPIQGGREGILPVFQDWDIIRLDMVITSHYDGDHIGGLAEVLMGHDGQHGTEDDYRPGVIYDRGGEKAEGTEQGLFEEYRKTVSKIRQTLKAGDRILLPDGVVITCMIADGKVVGQNAPPPADENSRSLGLLIEYGAFRYFTAGDLTGGGISGGETVPNYEGVVAPLVGPVDVLHVNHHGSETSSSPPFLDSLEPSAALISLGDGNRYGHPAPVVLHRLHERGIDVYQTEQGNGGILPEAFVANGMILMSVGKDGVYTINGNGYGTKM